MLRNRLSAFTPLQRRLFVVTFVSGALTVLNALYLVIAAHVLGTGRDPEVLPVTYQFMLVLHVCGGILACVAAIFFVATHVPRIIHSRRWMMRESGFFLPVLWVLLLGSGLFILTEANSRENMWMFVVHQVAAVLLLLAYFAHRRLSRSSPTISIAMRAGLVAAAVLVAVGAVHFAETGGVSVELSVTADAASAGDTTEQPAHSDDVVPAALSPFRAPGDPDPDSPLYPSKTTTTTGGYLPSRILTHDDIPDLEKFSAQTREHGFAPDYFLGAQTCQRCHADVVEQWATSAHRFASFNNPFYRRSVEFTREKAGRKPSKFCGGCHDPAIMLAGNMEKDIDPLTPESQAGLTCLACHAIDAIHDRTGNGNYNIHDRTESPYLFDLSKHGLALTVHDYVLKAKPTAHKQRMLKPFFRDSEFCLTCHKVNLDVPVNNYRWVRGQNDYDAWHNSGFARNNPATWYEPPTVKTCQDCHMAPEPAAHGDVSSKGGMVRSHRFLAVNTALPAIRGDQETIRRIEKFLRDDKLRIDLFALRREDGTLIYPLDRQRPSVRAGEVVQVEVVVRNLGVGHTFPGGTNDSNEGWIDFSASIDGVETFRSGAVQPNRHVDPSAHFYQAVIVDRHAERIAMRNAADIYTTVYANVIRPSTSDVARYRFRVPKNAAGKRLQLRAALNWRKFNRTFTEFVYEGKDVPDLPITTIEESSLELQVMQTASPPSMQHAADDWKRYNDYGIGLFLDEDTRGALAMFEMVSRLQPQMFDGWLNQARTYLADGSLPKAEQMLRQASERATDQPRIAFFWGQLLERSGRLQEAVAAYRATLLAYPKSRDAWSRLGRVYWLMGRIEESVDAYMEVLEIDPEHAQSYHQLALAFKALAERAQDQAAKRKYAHAAAEADKAFQKYKLDENAPKVTQRYRERHEHDNRMSQPIVIHAQEGL